jgi:HAD superfamily hydrolase (TIGR01509 family)
MLKLILFDCDGVLVDSEMIASRVLAEEMSRRGYPLTAAECRRKYTGVSIATLMEKVTAEYGRPLPDDFPEILMALDSAVFTGELEAITGVDRALHRIPLAKCVASSSSPERIRQSLELTGLLDHFDPHVFSAHMVSRGKPAPDLFLFAAERMGVAPASCLVVEDSVAGVTAALAAEMRVLGFAGGGHAGPGYVQMLRDAGAATVFEDMADLPGLLGL